MAQATNGPSGFSADTEILTRRSGWLTFDRLTHTDEVATRSPDGRLEWQSPQRIIWQPYEGDMVWLHSRTTDLLVTPPHRILYRQRRRDAQGGHRVELDPAEAVSRASGFIGRSVSLIGTSYWEPSHPKPEFMISPTISSHMGCAPRSFKASAGDFAAFMGMYLAEGSLGPPCGGEYPIYIWQSARGRGFAEYQILLDRIVGRAVPWHGGTNQGWCFRNKALYEYLKRCGGYAWTKVIPTGVLELPREHLETFWHYYWVGDGSLMRSAGRKDLEVIQSTSKATADAFQEVLQKLGAWSPIHRVSKCYPSNLGATRRTVYRVIRRAGYVAFATKVTAVPYEGMIGCVRVPNDMVYVRRTDHPVWAGSA